MMFRKIRRKMGQGMTSSLRIISYLPKLVVYAISYIQFCFIFCFLLWMTFYLIWYVGATDIFTCNHSSFEPPFCQHQSWRLLGLHYKTTEWQLLDAQIIETSDGNGVSYGLALTTNQGEIRLPYSLGDRKTADQELARFNELREGAFRSKFYSKYSKNLLENAVVLLFSILPFLFSLGWIIALLSLVFRKIQQVAKRIWYVTTVLRR